MTFSDIKIFRPLNLLIMAFTMFIVRYCIVLPAFITEYHNTGVFPLHLSKTEFLLLVFASLAIAAGGYVINDVFDVHMDAINKPGKNIVGVKISAVKARSVSFLLFVIGSIIGVSLGVRAGIPSIGFILPFSAATLYMYSVHFKRRLLTGNLLIALLSALSVLLVALFEPRFYPNIQFVLIYAAFAFMISLIREIIKDAEDMEGDELSQCKTFPIRFGIKRTKILLTVLIVVNLAIILSFLAIYFYTNTVLSFWYLAGMFVIPFAALAWLVITAEVKKDFHYASVFAKVVMIYGILTIIPFYFYFLR